MMRALFIASSGMLAQQTNIDVISNNLANVNTTGFKKSRAEFQSLLYQSLRKPAVSDSGPFPPIGLEVGNGVRVIGTLTDYKQGSPQETGNDLDVSIDGKGFFMVELPDGRVGYTRNGAFKIDSDGYLVNSNGYRLLSAGGNASAASSITVGGKTMRYIMPDTDSNTVIIGSDGTISTEKVGADNPAAPVLDLAAFPNPAALEAIGATLFVPNEVCGEVTVGQPTQDGMGYLWAGFLEGSNVNIVEEMVNMIIAQRAYEINSKAIQTSDELMSLTNNLKR